MRRPTTLLPCIIALFLAVPLGPAHAQIVVVASHGQSVRATIDGFPLLVLRGTHAQRGEAHGALAARDIISVCDGMARMINGSGLAAGRKDMSWATALTLVRRFEFPQRFEEELAGMLRGIDAALPDAKDRMMPSLGRPITLEDLKVLQTGDLFELMRCSQFSAWGPLTADGDVIIGRNWDYPPLFPIERRCLLAIEPAEDGLKATLDAMWFGMVGTGMATLTSDGTYYSANDGGIRTGGLVLQRPSPAALVMRNIAETADPATAIEGLARGIHEKVALCLIFHVVSTAGGDVRAAAIEDDPRPGGNGTKVRRPQAAVPTALGLTNHCILSDPRTSGDSADRYRRLETFLGKAGAAAPIGFEEARAMLDRVSKASAASTTYYSAVVWPRQRRMMVSVAPQPLIPATRGTYVSVEWEKVFALRP